MATAIARSQARATFTDTVRIQLLESDMDESDNKVDRILAGQNRLMWWAMGLVASLTTTSILLFVNLVK
jgi:hypothetical protein